MVLSGLTTACWFGNLTDNTFAGFGLTATIDGKKCVHLLCTGDDNWLTSFNDSGYGGGGTQVILLIILPMID